jgi:hypothetical protein
MDIKQTFRNYFFSYTIIGFIFLAGVLSYHRFITRQDYMVSYEGICDPIVNITKCFQGCDDDACTEVHYYSKMLKYAPDLHRECGEDITDCESANLCLPGDRQCSVTYCNPEVKGDTCAMETDSQKNENDTNEESIQNNESVNNVNL